MHGALRRLPQDHQWRLAALCNRRSPRESSGRTGGAARGAGWHKDELRHTSHIVFDSVIFFLRRPWENDDVTVESVNRMLIILKVPCGGFIVNKQGFSITYFSPK